MSQILHSPPAKPILHSSLSTLHFKSGAKLLRIIHIRKKYNTKIPQTLFAHTAAAFSVLMATLHSNTPQLLHHNFDFYQNNP